MPFWYFAPRRLAGSLELDSSSTLTRSSSAPIRFGVLPGSPDRPAMPGGPGGPAGPAIPGGPGGPASPAAPGGPGGPTIPSEPAVPGGPRSPWGSCRPIGLHCAGRAPRQAFSSRPNRCCSNLARLHDSCFQCLQSQIGSVELLAEIENEIDRRGRNRDKRPPLHDRVDNLVFHVPQSNRPWKFAKGRRTTSKHAIILGVPATQPRMAPNSFGEPPRDMVPIDTLAELARGSLLI